MLNVIVSSDLMHDYVAAAPVSGDRAIATAVTRAGETLLATIGQDDQVYLFTKADGSPTGWRRTNLSADLIGGGRPTHIATAQSPDGNPLLAIASEGPAGPTLHVVSDLTPDARPGRWRPLGTRAGVAITALATGAGKGGDPLITVTTATPDGRLTACLARPDGGDWQDVPVPLDGKSVIGVALGHNTMLETMDGVDGLIYTLIRQADGTTQLLLTSFPDFKYFNHAIDVPDGATALALAPPAGDGTDLLLAGSRLFHLDPANQVARNPSAAAQDAWRVGSVTFPHSGKALSAGRYPDGRLETWALTEDGAVWFANQADAGGAWGEPFPIGAAAGQMTAWRNAHSGDMDLFTVDEQEELRHHWQDQDTRQWRDLGILLDATDKVLETPAFHAQLTFLDDDGLPLSDKAVTINASQLCLLNLNGGAYFVDQQSDGTVARTDARGMVHVAMRTSSLSAPIIRLKTDDMAKSVELDANAAIAAKLSSVSDADLRAAGAKGSATDLASCAQALGQLVRMQTRLRTPTTIPDATVGTDDLGRDSVVAAEAGSPVSSAIDVGQLPADYFWGMDLSGKDMVFVSQRPALAQAEAVAAGTNSVGDEITHFFGDLWRHIRNGLIKVEHLVFEAVKEGVRVIVKAAGAVYCAVMKVIEDVWDVIGWILEQLALGLVELITWLGFKFDWDAILRTQSVLVNAGNLGCKEAVDQIKGLEQQIQDQLEKVRQLIASATAPLSMPGADTVPLRQIPSHLGAAPLQTQPRSNWALNKLSQGSFTSATIGPPLHFDSQGLEGILRDFAWNEAESVGVAIEKGADALAEDLPKKNFADAVERILPVLADAVVAGAENVIVSLLRVAELGLEGLEAFLNMELEIPILSTLYKQKQGRALTLIGCVGLIAAFPMTVGFQIATGREPFPAPLASKLAGATTFASFVAVLSAQPAPVPHALSASVSPHASLTASAVLGICSGVVRLCAHVCFAVKEAPGAPVQATYLKAVFDLLGASLGAISLGTRKPASASAGAIAIIVATGQFLFVLRDIVFACTKAVGILPAKNMTFRGNDTPVQDVAECAGAVAEAVLGVVFTVLIGVEMGIDKSGWGKDYDKKITGYNLKVSQAFFTIVYRLFAPVQKIGKTVSKYDPEPDSKAAADLAYKTGFAVRGLTSIIVVGLVIAKAAVDFDSADDYPAS